MKTDRPANLGDDVKADDVLGMINRLEVQQKWHDDRSAEIRQTLATIRDRLNGRARAKRSGKYTRKRKGLPITPAVADASVAAPDDRPISSTGAFGTRPDVIADGADV